MPKCECAFIQIYLPNNNSKIVKEWTSQISYQLSHLFYSCCYFRSLYVNMVGLWITVSLAIFSGLTMYSIYKDCDPFTNNDVGSADQVKLTKL